MGVFRQSCFRLGRRGLLLPRMMLRHKLFLLLLVLSVTSLVNSAASSRARKRRSAYYGGYPHYGYGGYPYFQYPYYHNPGYLWNGYGFNSPIDDWVGYQLWFGGVTKAAQKGIAWDTWDPTAPSGVMEGLAANNPMAYAKYTQPGSQLGLHLGRALYGGI